jgi:hypothetical protein
MEVKNNFTIVNLQTFFNVKMSGDSRQDSTIGASNTPSYSKSKDNSVPNYMLASGDSRQVSVIEASNKPFYGRNKDNVTPFYTLASGDSR